MTITLTEMFDLRALYQAVNGGYVSVIPHPYLPLALYTTTDKITNPLVWPPEIEACYRGLIVNTETGEIICRPWQRIYNSRKLNILWEADTPVEVTESIDGQLGLLYPDSTQQTGFAIATRNSFSNQVAIHATDKFQLTCGQWKPRAGFTYLFEIVCPETKNIVNYGQEDDLYLIGILNTDSTDIITVRHPHVSVPRTFAYRDQTYNDFLSLHSTKQNHFGEGFVVRNLNTNDLVKYQTDDFVEEKEKRNGVSRSDTSPSPYL